MKLPELGGALLAMKRGMAHRFAPFIGLFALVASASVVPACAGNTTDSDSSDDDTDRGQGGITQTNPPAPSGPMPKAAAPGPGSFQDGVSPSTKYAGAIDTTIRQSAPTTADGSDATVTADYDDPAGSGKHTSGLLRFDLSSIPAGSKVTAVKLTVNVTNRTSGTGYALYPLSRSWSDSQATWNSASSGHAWATAGARGASDRKSTAMASLAPSTTGTATVSFNASGVAAVQDWVDSPAANFGFVVDTADDYDGLQFDSSNATTAANRPRLDVTFSTPKLVSPYPVYTQADVDAWSTSNPEYTRLASSWAGNVSRAYTSYGTSIDPTERDLLKDESVYIKTQAVLWAADGNAARKNKVIALLNDLRGITSWDDDPVEQRRLVCGWVSTNLAQGAAIIGYEDPAFTKFLVDVNYPLMDWPGSNNWNASFADSKLAIAVYVGDENLYADAKAYFYAHIAESNYHSAYDGNKVKPCLGTNGMPDPTATVRNWGGFWSAPQVKTDYTFVDPSYVTDGFNAETIRDLGHVSLGLGAWMHGARTILAHGETLEKQAYDRLHAAYALHAHRVLTYKTTGKMPAPVSVKGDGGTALDQSWYGARKLFGSDTPSELVTLCGNVDVTTFPAAGANHLVDEAFADGE